MLKDEYMTATEICYILGISENTLRNWMKWYKIKKIECPELPQPEKFHNRNYWRRTDIAKFAAFKDWIPKGRNGVMAEVNHIYWKKKG